MRTSKLLVSASTMASTQQQATASRTSQIGEPSADTLRKSSDVKISKQESHYSSRHSSSSSSYSGSHSGSACPARLRVRPHHLRVGCAGQQHKQHHARAPLLARRRTPVQRCPALVVSLRRQQRFSKAAAVVSTAAAGVAVCARLGERASASEVTARCRRASGGRGPDCPARQCVRPHHLRVRCAPSMGRDCSPLSTVFKF